MKFFNFLVHIYVCYPLRAGLFTFAMLIALHAGLLFTRATLLCKGLDCVIQNGVFALLGLSLFIWGTVGSLRNSYRGWIEEFYGFVERKYVEKRTSSRYAQRAKVTFTDKTYYICVDSWYECYRVSKGLYKAISQGDFVVKLSETCIISIDGREYKFFW